MENYKSEQNSWKIFVEEHIFGKVASPQSAVLSKKMNSIANMF